MALTTSGALSAFLRHCLPRLYGTNQPCLAVGQAFDEAWAEIAGHFGTIPTEVESARLRLAEAMLSVATEGSTDVAALKAGALQAMALDYRSGLRLMAKPQK